MPKRAKASRLQWYIGRQVVVAFLIVCGTITGAIWTIGSLRHLTYIINNDMPLLRYLYFNGLLVPIELNATLMPSAVIAILFVYNRLVGDREFVAMKSAGLGNWRLAAPGLVFAGVAALFMAAHQSYLLPQTYREFRAVLHDTARNGLVLNFREKEFTSVADNLVVYVGDRLSSTQFTDVLVWDNREREEPIAMIADTATLTREGDRPFLVLFDGNQQTHERDDNEVVVAYFEQFAINLDQFVDDDERTSSRRTEAYFHELWNRTDFDALDPDSLSDQRAIHKRLGAPLKVFAAMIVALALILSGAHSRAGRAAYIMAAIVAMLGLEAGFVSLANTISTTTGYAYLTYPLGLAVIAISLAVIGRRRLGPPWPFARRRAPAPAL